MKRLESLERCVFEVLSDGIPGDLVETGVWRGGASILMRGVLAAFEDRVRRVWVIASFEGLPMPNVERFPAAAGRPLALYNSYLGVSLKKVQVSFARYGLLDDQFRFLEGWFRDSLPSAPIDRIAVLRTDGDLYGVDDGCPESSLLESLARRLRCDRRLRCAEQLQDGSR